MVYFFLLKHFNLFMLTKFNMQENLKFLVLKFILDKSLRIAQYKPNYFFLLFNNLFS